jgi:hypothetical protein
MADAAREDTVEAVTSGKITWGAHFDSNRGPLCTKWDVTRVPTVYVIGPDGKIAESGFLPADQLKTRVAELLR